jgi:hypothetical protein
MSKIKLVKKTLTELAKKVKRKPKVSSTKPRHTEGPAKGRPMTKLEQRVKANDAARRNKKTTTKPKTTTTKPKTKTRTQGRKTTKKKTEAKTTTTPKKPVDAASKFTRAEKRRQARARLKKTKKGKESKVKGLAKTVATYAAIDTGINVATSGGKSKGNKQSKNKTVTKPAPTNTKTKPAPTTTKKAEAPKKVEKKEKSKTIKLKFSGSGPRTAMRGKMSRSKTTRKKS